MTNHGLSPLQLGWAQFFQQQLSVEELETTAPARVMEAQYGAVTVMGETGERSLPLVGPLKREEEGVVVGDWLLLDRETGQPVRVLDRASFFRRPNPLGNKVQPMAANVDTLFIVSSMNMDFSLNRLERYMALAHSSGAQPVVVLTKKDQTETPEEYVAQVRTLGRDLVVEAVNAKDPAAADALAPWLQTGRTIGLLGSSGVGKSTLLNTINTAAGGDSLQKTGAIRDEDSKGRHTTTARSLHLLANGALLLDTPGMRELQLLDCEEGVHAAFNDVAELAAQCRFTDCTHENEPGCAVRQALEAGDLTPRRLDNYLALLAEQARNTETLAQRRKREKSQGKLYKAIKKEKGKTRLR